MGFFFFAASKAAVPGTEKSVLPASLAVGSRPESELPPSDPPPAPPARAGAPVPELSSSSLPTHPEPTPSDNVTFTPVSHKEKPVSHNKNKFVGTWKMKFPWLCYKKKSDQMYCTLCKGKKEQRVHHFRAKTLEMHVKGGSRHSIYEKTTSRYYCLLCV